MRQNEWQKLDVKKIMRALRKHTRVLYVAPTGAGKTRIAGNVIVDYAQRGKRVVFIAHTTEIVRQAKNELERQGLRVGVRMNSSPFDLQDRSAGVQICGIQTLMRRGFFPTAELVVVDEAHHSLAKSYRDAMLRYGGVPTLGLTATPITANRDGLRGQFDEMVLGPMPSQLVEWGHVARPIIYSHPIPSTEDIRVARGDFMAGDLTRRLNRPTLVGNIVEHWKSRAVGRRTVAFACSIEHSIEIVAAFNNAGVVAEHIDGTTSQGDRASALARLDAGETGVISTCGLIGEGFDLPSIECGILARPTRSLIVYLQQAGRVLRPCVQRGGPFDGTSGLVDPIILDHSGNATTQKHGSPIEDRPWTLDGLPKRSNTAKTPTKACPNMIGSGSVCGRVVPAATQYCPECNFHYPTSLGRGVLEEDGELELYGASSEEDKQRKRLILERLAESKGLPKSWIEKHWLRLCA